MSDRPVIVLKPFDKFAENWLNFRVTRLYGSPRTFKVRFVGRNKVPDIVHHASLAGFSQQNTGDIPQFLPGE